MQGPPEVTVYNRPPEALAKLLTLFDPLHTLPLVRRLQFTRFPGGITEHTRILFSSTVSLEERLTTATAAVDTDSNIHPDAKDKSIPPFAAAYLDFSRGPETELWVYSSLERRCSSSAAGKQADADGDDELEKQEIASVLALLRNVKRREAEYFAPGSARAAAREHPTLLVGNLNEVLRARLVGAGVDLVSTGLYDKFLFCVEDLPDVKLPDGISGDGRSWVWDRVRPEDIPLTILRTKIPRREYVCPSPFSFFFSLSFWGMGDGRGVIGDSVCD